MKKTVPEDNLSINKEQEKQSKHTRVEGSEEQPLKSSDRIVAGFLVSFSADPTGKYWVLYEGRNRIGSDKSNDVAINDANVSSNHAILNIRHSVNDGRMLVAISDQNSSNGTIVNKKDIEFTTLELNNEDIIQMGSHEFGLLFISRYAKGLEPAEGLKQSAKKSGQYTSPYDVSVKSNTSKRTKPE
jgi:pSer/pThr/pTyr-binding forkhead associated (FHA) protein